MARRFRKPWMDRVLCFVIGQMMKLIIRTLRVEIEDKGGTLQLSPDNRMIWLAWHNRIFIVPHLFEHYFRPRPGSAMTSASRDGLLLAGVLAQFGIGAIHGSSSKKGFEALREAIKRIRAGQDICITPDGPRGPRYELAPGVVSLAQMTGCPVMPIHVDYHNAWVLPTWDQLRIPKPFSRVSVILGALEAVPRDGGRNPGAVETQRLRLQEILRSALDPDDQPPGPAGRKK